MVTESKVMAVEVLCEPWIAFSQTSNLVIFSTSVALYGMYGSMWVIAGDGWYWLHRGVDIIN